MNNCRRRYKKVAALFLAVGISLSTLADDKSAARSGLVKLPQVGGTVTGETGNFSIDGNKGASNFQLPLPELPSRAGINPSIGLTYNQFVGDTGFGMGWSWSISSIEVTEQLGVPIPGQLSTGEFRNFLSLNGEDLVFVAKQGTKLHYKLKKSTQSVDVYYHSNIYTPAHAKKVSNKSPAIPHGFEVHYPDGRIQLFSGDLAIAEGSDSIVTKYPLVYEVAPTGESIAYSYEKIDEKSYLSDIHFAGGNSHYQFEMMAQPTSNLHYNRGFAQKTSRRYNKVTASYKGNIHAQMCFAYSSRKSEQQSGFSIKSHADCQNVANTELTEQLDNSALHVTDQLLAIYRYGNDDNFSANTDHLPTVYFDYSSWTKAELSQRDLVYPLAELIDQTGFAPENYELADLNHDSLVDVIRRNSNNTTDVFYASANESLIFDAGKRWELQRGTQQVSPDLMSENFHFADMNGDTYVDIVEFDGTKAHLFLGQADGGFDAEPQAVFLDDNQEISGNMFKNGYARFLDLNADGKSDILTTTTSASGVRQFKIYFNFSELTQQGRWDFFLYGRTYRTPENSSSYSLANDQIKIVDVNGDRLPDLLQLRSSSVDNQSGVCVYQNRGDIYDIKTDVDYLFGQSDQQHERCGTGGQFITLNGLRGVNNLNNVWLADVNGDGVLDFSTIGELKSELLVWLGLGDLTVIDSPFSFSLNIPVSINLNDSSRSRVADIDGDGQSEILLFNASNDTDNRVLLLDFNRSDKIQLVKSNLLTTVDFDSGLRHDVLYATSTDERVRDIRQGQPVRNLHFPVILAKQLISSYGQRGESRDNVQVQEFFYHRPFYNPGDNEFDGFESIERLTYGDDYANESHYSITHYHTNVGNDQYALAGKMLSKSDYRLNENAVFEQLSNANRSFDPNDSAAHSLSQMTQEQALPTTAQLLKKVDYLWQAQDLGGYYLVRQEKIDEYQYGADTQPAHIQTLFEGYDIYNLPAKVTQTDFERSSPWGVKTPTITTVIETFYDQSRSSLSQLGIVNAPSSVYQSRNGEALSYQENVYQAQGLIDTETHYVLSRVAGVPAQLQADYKASNVRTLHHEYDVYGNPTQLSDELGVLEHVSYDSEGVFPSRYDKGAKTGINNWQFEYNAGRLYRSKSPLGLWSEYSYDKLGRKKQISSDNASQQNFYYKFGRNANPSYVLTDVKRYVSETATPAGEQSVVSRLSAYNAYGQLLAQMEGAHASLDDNSDGLRVKSYRVFNRQKNQKFKWTPYKISGVSVQQVFDNYLNVPLPTHSVGTTFSYDSLNRISLIEYPEGKTQEFDYETWGVRETSRYQSREQTVTIQCSEVANSLGVYAVVESDGEHSSHITRFDRDSLGYLHSIQLPGQTATRALTYDTRERLEYQSLPGMGERYYIYDQRDRLRVEARLSQGGETVDIIRHSYDAMNRKIETSANGILHTEYRYDTYGAAWDTQSSFQAIVNQPAGQLSQVQTYDHNGLFDFKEQLGYDLQGNIVHREVKLGDKILGESYEVTLDGTVRRVKTPLGLEGIYTLGKDSYLRSVDIQLPDDSEKHTVLDSVIYNGGGKLEKIRYRNTAENFSETVLTYAPENLQLTHIKSHYRHDGESVELQNLLLELNQNNSILSINDSVDDTGYGHVDRTAEFSYNWKDELVSATRFGKSFDYAYSAGGSFILNEEMGENALPSGAGNSMPPQVDASLGYEFNGFGQLKRSVKLVNASYDAFGQLVIAETVDHKIYYGYNAKGNRIYKKIVNKADLKVRESLYPMDSTVFEPNGAQSYLFVSDSRLVRLENETGKWFYYLKDHLESSDIVMSSYGVPVEQMLYQPYGTEEDPAEYSSQWSDHRNQYQDEIPQEKTHHRYTGKYLDVDTGLYDYGLRYYDPLLGRFISPDPKFTNDPKQCLQSVRECNLYIYALNNPVKYVDKTGEFAFIVTGLISAAIDVGIQYATNDNHDVNWKKVGVAFVAGAAGVGIASKVGKLAQLAAKSKNLAYSAKATETAVNVGGNAIGGSALNVTATVANNAIDGKRGEALTDGVNKAAVIGGFTGAAGYATERVISSFSPASDGILKTFQQKGVLTSVVGRTLARSTSELGNVVGNSGGAIDAGVNKIQELFTGNEQEKETN